jgi:hypothetical protein
LSSSATDYKLNGMKWLVFALTAFLFAGCVSQPVDWQARVGHYTQAQAVQDFGPPDKTEKMSDGTVVDEWRTDRAHVIVAPEPYFLPRGGYFGPDTPSYSETYVPDYFRRLTFGPDERLQAWKSYAK